MLWKIFGYGNECDAIEVKANSFDEALTIARKIDKAFRAGFVVKKICSKEKGGKYLLIFQIVLGLLAAAISIIAANKINTWPFVSVYWLILSIYWLTMANKNKNADDRER